MNVAHNGFEMVVYDVRPEATTPLVERGAKAAGSPVEVLDQVDVVVTMVFGPKEGATKRSV